jgi:hypothetical protein
MSALASACMREQLGCMLPLHVRPTTPLVAAQIGLSPGADLDQYRRSPGAAPAQM